METNNQPLVPQGWIRVVIFLVVLLAANLGLGLLFENSGLLLKEGESEEQDSSLFLFVLLAAASVLSILVVIFFRKFIDRMSIASMGLGLKNHLPDAFSGFFLSLAILSIGSFILFLNGNLSWVDITMNGTDILSFILVIALIAISEELSFRGYVLNNLMKSVNKWVALFISAAIFTLFHVNNPSIGLLPVAGIFAGGILLGLNYIYTKNLLFSILFHFAWNLYQGPMLGYEVSGVSLNPLLQQDLTGDALITGGDFGFEGSILSVILLLISILILYLVYEKKQKPIKVRRRK